MITQLFRTSDSDECIIEAFEDTVSGLFRVGAYDKKGRCVEVDLTEAQACELLTVLEGYLARRPARSTGGRRQGQPTGGAVGKAVVDMLDSLQEDAVAGAAHIYQHPVGGLKGHEFREETLILDGEADRAVAVNGDANGNVRLTSMDVYRSGIAVTLDAEAVARLGLFLARRSPSLLSEAGNLPMFRCGTAQANAPKHDPRCEGEQP